MRATRTFIFHRPALAERCCDSLEGIGLVDNRQGLFMAAPKRTGKSTFLREDLLPAMQQRGWTTIYMDLRAALSKDPVFLMMSTITAEITAFAKQTKLPRFVQQCLKMFVLTQLTMLLATLQK